MIKTRVESVETKESVALRLRAEETLQKDSALASHQLLSMDREKLLNELQVHQIELEIQNEELQFALMPQEVPVCS